MSRVIIFAIVAAATNHSTDVCAFIATTSKLPSSGTLSITPSKHSTVHGSSCLSAYRERSRYDQKGSSSSRSSGNNNNNRRRRRDTDNNTDDFVTRGYDEFDDDFSQEYNTQHQQQENTRHRTLSNEPPSTSSSTTQTSTSSTFYSQKSLSDPSFSLIDQDSKNFFQRLCNAANIKRPSRIQSLAWPPLLQNENCIVADQTGSGKTLSYLLPLLQKLHSLDTTNTGGDGKKESTTQYKKKRTGTPRVVVLTPTAELADQIYSVCSSLSKNLSDMPIINGEEQQVPWTFNPFVTTATGSHSTNIRDQIRLLQSTPIDILISTPGRLSTILRTKNAGLDLGLCTSLVLDEVDFLLVDETFGPQLRTVGVAVNNGSEDESNSAQFIFVTATLPEDVLESIQSEFENIVQVRGPGLHRITPAVSQTLIDVSVPATSNRDARACFDIKVQEMLVALRGKRCSKTLIFCNTVETCRNVENVLRRKDRKNKRSKVWAYHNALSPEVRLKNLQMFSSSGSSSGGSEDNGEESILVCTDRAARGIDFDASPIDHVLLFDFPKDPAEYVRRVGRTARAGRTGACTVLAYGWQLPIARQIMGLSDGKNKKGKKKKRGSAVLEASMMKSDDGWDDDGNDEYVIKNGERRRKSGSGGGEKRSGGNTGGDSRKRKPGKKRGDKGKPWEK